MRSSRLLAQPGVESREAPFRGRCASQPSSSGWLRRHGLVSSRASRIADRPGTALQARRLVQGPSPNQGKNMRFLVASVLIAPLAFAQAPAAGAASPKVVSGAMGLSFTTHYYFRGILQENQGIIAQPWLEVGYGLYEGKDSLKNVGLTFGLWNSLHDGPTGTGGGGSMWYESDFFIELSADIGERLSVGTTYTSYYGANGVKPNVQEIAFSANYNDDKGQFISGLASGLQPSVVLAFEL